MKNIELQPDISVRLTMYCRKDDPSRRAKKNGWRAPCFPDKSGEVSGYTGHFFIGNDPLKDGETRNVGIKFLNPEDAMKHFKKGKQLFVWEMGFLAEGIVL